MKQFFAVCAVVLFSVVGICRADTPAVVDLSQYPADSVWCASNSRVTATKDKDGNTVWRWKIGQGQEAFLWLNEKLPVHADLQQYQRFDYEINFAKGRIDLVWPRTIGVLPAPYDNLYCEWNLFYSTYPRKTWIPYQQVFNDPSWNSSAMGGVPKDVQMDRKHLLEFVCLPKGPGCVVELRNCRLIRDRILVQKPYLTKPLGWPERDKSASPLTYRTPYFVKNVSDKPAKVSGVPASKLKYFDVRVEPAEATLQPDEVKKFTVVATRNSTPATTRPMVEETAVVNFVPDGDESVAYRTKTFCTELTQKPTRMVIYSPDELAKLKREGEQAVSSDAQFWMKVKLSGTEEIPMVVGHRVVYPGMPIRCPKCGKGHMHMTHDWLTVQCDQCGYKEHHTPIADATWVASWSAIHGYGPSPASLGTAYLATGDEKYAKKAIELLTLLARHYQEIPWHNSGYPKDAWAHAEPPGPDAWTNGASARWGNTPTYGTDFMVQHLAELSNMIVNAKSWTPDERKLVHEGLWVPAATEMMKITPGISNMNDIINRDLILAALSTNDANMLYRGTLYPTGISARMSDISLDGFSDEGSALNYHLAAMREWLPSIKLLLSTGLDWGDLTQRAVAAVKMPLLRATLNGTAYETGNSGTSWAQIPLNHPMFELADKIFPESLWPRKRAYDPDPILFRNAGWAILRTGKTADQQVQVDLDFGRSHGHGDLDRMNLGLFALGEPLSADPGSTYNFNWSAHDGPAAASMNGPFVANTVVVDGHQQLLGAGRLLKWDIAKDHQTVAAEIEGIYPGVKWKRSVTLLHNVVVVVDDLSSDESHRYESAWHFMGKGDVAGNCGATAMTEPLGTGDYKDLLHPKRIKGSPVVMQWESNGVKTRLWQAVQPEQLAYTAQTGICWGDVRGLPVDGLFTRRSGKSTRYVTVLEPFKGTPGVGSIALDGDALKLTFADGTSSNVNVGE